MTHPQKQPVDLNHLDRYTGGDHAINAEILSLFETSCGQILAQLRTLAVAGDPGGHSKAWHQAAHTLKGAARGIGAFALGDAAEEAEKKGLAPVTAIEAVAAIEVQALAVHDFIAAVLKDQPA